MNLTSRLAAVTLLFATLAGCVVTPEEYETTPVKVQTSAGTVTCQLYTKELVTWDRAIDRPASMTVQQADAICKEEGRRQAGLS